MPVFKCPGQDTRYWRPQDVSEIRCHGCSDSLELWKDEPFRRCPKCGARVRNPKFDSSCAKWCQYAKECLGYVPLEDEADESVCDRLIDAMKATFGRDRARITHTLNVLHQAEEILSDEGGLPLVVKAAAILHDIGIQEAERKHGSSAGHYQEIEGPPIARRIMEEIGLDPPTMEHVCRIVAHHHSARNIDTREFRIIWDADWLVNFPQVHPDVHEAKCRRLIEQIFRTAAGKKKAVELFLTGATAHAGEQPS